MHGSALSILTGEPQYICSFSVITRILLLQPFKRLFEGEKRYQTVVEVRQKPKVSPLYGMTERLTVFWHDSKSHRFTGGTRTNETLRTQSLVSLRRARLVSNAKNAFVIRTSYSQFAMHLFVLQTSYSQLTNHVFVLRIQLYSAPSERNPWIKCIKIPRSINSTFSCSERKKALVWT